VFKNILIAGNQPAFFRLSIRDNHSVKRVASPPKLHRLIYDNAQLASGQAYLSMGSKMGKDSRRRYLNSSDFMEVLHFKADKLGYSKVACFDEISLLERNPI
jgi:hypothetical protein